MRSGQAFQSDCHLSDFGFNVNVNCFQQLFRVILGGWKGYQEKEGGRTKKKDAWEKRERTGEKEERDRRKERGTSFPSANF